MPQVLTLKDGGQPSSSGEERSFANAVVVRAFTVVANRVSSEHLGIILDSSAKFPRV